jgi:outer membrane protein, multidrug efflux system
MWERAFGFNLFGLLSTPWRAKWQSQVHEQNTLATAQRVAKLAADTRKAWFMAVAAQQSAEYAEQSKVAAEAAGELARRMARVGNWSRLNQAREQAFLADATTALAKAQNAAFAEREKLIRLLGLWGNQTQFELPTRLPELPATTLPAGNLEQLALEQRLDVRAAVRQTESVAQMEGYTQVTGIINALDFKAIRETTTDQTTQEVERKRAWELELPIPIFDWGQAGNAKSQARYMQAVAHVRASAVNARSEVREAWHAYRTAHDVAKHYQTEVLPLRKFINEQTLLRYNGMLVGVFDLIADTRTNIAAATSSIEALRDFWLIESDLLLSLSGTSPGGVSAMNSSAASGGEAKGH